MASVAQIQANRSNAQKSTGPRTAEGKATASRNAVKHGLLAEQVVIHGEDPAQFELYREGMLAELAPVGGIETMLAERAVSLAWRLRRAERLQSAVFATVYRENAGDIVLWPRHGLPIEPKPDEEAVILGQVVMTDFARAQVLDRLLVHERRIESSLYRTMAELRKEREAREAGRESAAEAELGSFGEDGAGEVSSVKCQVSSDECGPDTSADSQSLTPGGSDKRGLRSLSMASSQGQDHRQTSLSLPPGVEERRSDFTLQTSHFKLEEKITPYGVTTNEEKTTPCGVVANDEGRATPSASETLHASPFTLHDSFRETKPIPGGPA
jgi:hypothetical protein